MPAPISAPPTVLMKPSTEEAVPATWPSGSMASELKFEPIQPKLNIAKPKKPMNRKNGIGCGPNTKASSQIVLIDMKAIKAPCDSLRIPNLPTSREFRKDDID